MKILTADDLEITLIAEPSTVDAYGQLGDCMSKKQIRELLEKAETNEWHWCDVKVRAEWNGLTASDYLGACSYKDRHDFVKTSGYYDDMLGTVLADIQAQAEAIAGQMVAA